MRGSLFIAAIGMLDARNNKSAAQAFAQLLNAEQPDGLRFQAMLGLAISSGSAEARARAREFAREMALREGLQLPDMDAIWPAGIESLLIFRRMQTYLASIPHRIDRGEGATVIFELKQLRILAQIASRDAQEDLHLKEQLAIAFRRSGQYETARGMLDELIERDDKPRTRAVRLLEIARIEFALGRFSSAADYAEESFEVGRAGRVTYFGPLLFASVACRLNGDYARARGLLERIRKSGEDRAPLVTLLELARLLGAELALGAANPNLLDSDIRQACQALLEECTQTTLSGRCISVLA
jgi:tetratricopeptide (TPR) repeat protein